MNINAPGIEHIGDDAGRPDLLEADFRILVKVATYGGQVCSIGGNALDDGHG